MSLVIWLTGLPASGKTTLAERIAPHLDAAVLDADLVRKSFWPELGFSKEDRRKNMERLTALAHLLQRSQVNVVVAAVTPFGSMRQKARDRLAPGYFEVYVDCSLGTRAHRDPNVLLPYETDIEEIYEEPASPDLVVHTDLEEVEESATKILDAVGVSVA